MKDNVVRISLLGGSGSGKTSFMGGIVQSLVMNAVRCGTDDNPCNIMLKPLSSVTAEDNIFDDDYDPTTVRVIQGAEVANELQKYIITSEFKTQTTTGSISEFEFALQINKMESCRMVISDYAGELFSSYEDHKSDFPKLAKKLAESDVLVIMADGVIISKYYSHSTNLQKYLNAQTFNMLFPAIADAANGQNKKMTVLVAITKADSPRISKSMKLDNFEDTGAMLVNQVYSTIYTICDNNGWNFGIIPVSCIGEGNTVVRSTSGGNEHEQIAPDADIKQKNIDLLIIYSLYIHIEDMTNYLRARFEQLNRECKPLKHPKDYVKSLWKDKISECDENIRRLEMCKEILRAHTFGNINEIVHQRLPKNAIPVLI